MLFWFIEWFFYERVLVFLKSLSASLQIDHVAFVFYSINMVYYISSFSDSKPAVHSLDNFYSAMVCNSLSSAGFLFFFFAGFHLSFFLMF